MDSRFWVKLGLGLISSAFGLWVVYTNARRGRQALAAIDRGSRCIRCDGGETVVEGDVVRCVACGYRASLAKLRARSLTDAEIDAATRPPEKGPLISEVGAPAQRGSTPL